MVYLGGILQFPEWLSRLSPFRQVPQLPAADLELLPLVALTVVAAALMGGGLAGFRRTTLRNPNATINHFPSRGHTTACHWAYQ